MLCPRCVEMRQRVEMRELGKSGSTQYFLCMTCKYRLTVRGTSVDRPRIEEGEMFAPEEDVD